MLFNSYTFIFAFLPVTLLVYLPLARSARRWPAIGWLLLASLVYYAWWNPPYVLLLLASMFVNFGLGLAVARAARPGMRRALFTLGVAANLTAIGYFKYTHFVLDSIGAAIGDTWSIGEILLPVGISFYTFQQIAYLADVYGGRPPERDFLNYGLFVTFFPQLIAGPIVHPDDVLPQFAAPYRGSSYHLAQGTSMFVLGLAKKVLIADRLSEFAIPVFAAADAGAWVGTVDAWLGALAFTGQLYFDFSGYSDMAVGLAALFGIRIPVNFNSPYKAASISDFWRRWHMTLSRFLRDYVYIPLGGNRRGNVRRYVNLMLTMLIGGLWHGAGWTFVFWGFLHGLYLCVDHAWGAIRRRVGLAPEATSAPGRLAGVGITFLAVVVGWVFFRAQTFAGAWRLLDGMFVPARSGGAHLVSRHDALFPIAAAMAVFWLFPNVQELHGNLDAARGERPAPSPVPLRWSPSVPWGAAIGALGLVCVAEIARRQSEFLYYQF